MKKLSCLNKSSVWALSLVSSFLIFQPVVNATPLGDVKMIYTANGNGTYTYYFRILNLGPLEHNVTTPPDYLIYDWRTQQSYPAGGKFLNDDKNLITFGIDTLNDEVEISNVTDGFGSSFEGGEEAGFADSDNDGIPNKVVSWHLPFDFTLDQALPPKESIWFISFTLDHAVTDFQYWVGGSDDAVIWNDTNVMLEDEYGIYDATAGAYLATFLTRDLKAKRISHQALWSAFFTMQ